MKSILLKSILAVVLPLGVFVLLETGLRIARFGPSMEFLIPDEDQGIYRTNPHFTDLFFPASFGLKPTNQRLSREKTPGSFRIFVLGESAAMGVPEPAFSISPQLQAQLRAAEPGRKIEVFNFGVTGINSHAVLRILRQAVRFDPDLLVVYMGNNEVVGPYGPGSVVTGGMYPRWLIRVGLWVNTTRIGYLVRWALNALRPAGSDFKEWRGMEMFIRNVVVADDPRLTEVYANFEANLDEMLAIARDARVKVVISTIAVNVRDSAPFVSRHGLTLSDPQLEVWNQSFARAVRGLDLGKIDLARSDIEQVLEIDPSYADTHFRLARLLDEAGNLSGARSHYLEALQLDALRFRADAQINDIIRRVAANYSPTALLVDASREFGSDAASSSPPAGTNLFFEHVHFRWDGNYALARLIAPVVRSALSGENSQSSAWLNSEECAEALGYTDLGHLAMMRGMAMLTGRPPFTGQSSYAEDRARLQREIAAAETKLAESGAVAAAVEKIESALQADPRNPRLLFQAAAARLQSGGLKAGLNFNDRLRLVLPFSPEAAAQRGSVLLRLGRSDEAEELLLQSAKAEPFYFQTYSLLAQLWISSNQLTKALGYFEDLVSRMPDGARSIYAQLLERNGDSATAEQQWRTILERMPDDELALDSLLDHLQRSNDEAAALRLMLNANAYNPRNFKNNSRLAQVYEARGDSEKVVLYLNALAESGPVNARLYLDLASHWEKLGNVEAMNIALVKARRVAEIEADSTVTGLTFLSHPE